MEKTASELRTELLRLDEDRRKLSDQIYKIENKAHFERQALIERCVSALKPERAKLKSISTVSERIEKTVNCLFTIRGKIEKFPSNNSYKRFNSLYADGHLPTEVTLVTSDGFYHKSDKEIYEVLPQLKERIEKIEKTEEIIKKKIAKFKEKENIKDNTFERLVIDHLRYYI